MIGLIIEALGIWLVAVIAYAIGYRSGVAHCARELKPLEDALKELRGMTRRL